METPIHDFLKNYAQSGISRLHMPGGKGLAFPHDITEIYGADVLYESSGIIRESERNAAELFGAGECCYSCGGATLAIQAMLAAAREITGKCSVAAGRCSHRSLIDTAVLLGLNVNWIYPEEFPCGTVSPADVESAIDSDTAAVFVTSVDYLGGQCDIPAIAEICKRRGALLLVDNAHGAYKVFTGDHPLRLGADMTADSAHKTLPAITGTAYAHLADSAYRDAVKSAMALFGSSSPSYLMLESLDLCNWYISEEREPALAAIRRVGELKTELAEAGIPLRESDGMRITIDANALGYTGAEYAQQLRQRGVECEMGGERYTVLLFSAVQPAADIVRVAEAIRAVPRNAPIQPRDIPVLISEAVMTPREAYFSTSELTPAGQSAGKICAGIQSPCPPCVPIVMPGERITAQTAELMLRYGIEYVKTVK